MSKLDELLLNPQVRTCSVAVPGSPRNNNSENRETTGDRPSDDLYPEVGYFSHHSGQLDSPETESNPHSDCLRKFFRLIFKQGHDGLYLLIALQSGRLPNVLYLSRKHQHFYFLQRFYIDHEVFPQKLLTFFLSPEQVTNTKLFEVKSLCLDTTIPHDFVLDVTLSSTNERNTNASPYSVPDAE